MYPKHLYDPIRITIATDYITHELRKMFSNLRQDRAWGIIDLDVKSWLTSEPSSARDFWNTFHGIAMGYKLKNHLTQLLTAENISWERKEFPINQFWFGVSLDHMQENWKEAPSASDVMSYFSRPENETERIEELKYSNKLSELAFERDIHPIIAIHKQFSEEVRCSVYEGNRRLLKAILEGSETILADVGTYTTDEKTPRNFWLPTSFLIDLVDAGILTENYEGTLGMLRELVKHTESGDHELKTRVLIGASDFRKKLKKDLYGE